MYNYLHSLQYIILITLQLLTFFTLLTLLTFLKRKKVIGSDQTSLMIDEEKRIDEIKSKTLVSLKKKIETVFALKT